MPATAARAAFASRDFRFDTLTSAAIKAAHPDARDQEDQPAVSFFDDIAAATAINAERGALLLALPRRLSVTIAEPLADLDTSLTTPTTRLVDAELGIDADLLISRLALDLETETTALELFRGDQ